MTAPAASTPKWRVSDEELGQFKTRALDYKWGARADVMLPAGFIGDLRDARALIAERDAELEELHAYALAATKAITNFVGGGSELFGRRLLKDRPLEMYTADLKFCFDRARDSRTRAWNEQSKALDKARKAEEHLATARAAGIAEGLKEAAKIADREFGALYDKSREILSSAKGEIPSDYFKAMDKAEGNRQTAAAIRAAIATASKGGDDDA